MRIGQIDFPDSLIEAAQNSSLTIFAGAGVSMGAPANLPSFKELADMIAQGTNESHDSGEPIDRFLGRLEKAEVNVSEKARQILTQTESAFNSLHKDLLRLFINPKDVQIVTTNFDLLFESAAGDIFEQKPEVYSAPALPIGSNFRGIVHVHGSLEPHTEIVLTDAAFGRAYLTEAWATRFLLDLFNTNTILFVGYSHDDVVMNYLSRALPTGGQRYALTTDKGNWEFLGIQPIIFQQNTSGDFSALNNAVEQFANFRNRGILVWKQELADIAALEKPPLDEEAIDKVKFAMNDATKTRLFLEHASSPEWISWLNDHKYLDGLFGTSPPSETEMLRGNWLADRFAIVDPEALWELLSAHRTQMGAWLWSRIADRLRSEKEDIDSTTLKKWIALLLHTMPRWPGDFVLLGLGEACAKNDAIESLVEIYRAAASHSLSLQAGINWYRENDEKSQKVRFEIDYITDHYDLSQLWVRCLKENIAEVAQEIAHITTTSFQQTHKTLTLVGQANRDWNHLSYGRSAIELHPQDKYTSSIDAIIDAARECLEWICANDHESAARWCENLIRSNSALCRRLAVHVMTERNDVNPNEKLDWLLANEDLHDVPLHHEIFRLVRSAYPSASADARHQIFVAITEYRWPDDDDDADLRTDSEHFCWLNWLHESCTESSEVEDTLKLLRTKYPLWQIEHPDFTHWSGEASWLPPEPTWTVEELLSLSPKEAILLFQEYVGEPKEDRTDRDNAEGIAIATKTTHPWSIGVANQALADSFWAKFMWDGLLKGWASDERNQEELYEITPILENSSLQENRADQIARLLFKLSEKMDEGSPVDWHLRLDAVATSIWEFVDREALPEKPDDWLNLAINRPAGILGEFWLKSVILWWNRQDPKPESLSVHYSDSLRTIIQDETLAGGLARCVFASQYRVFLRFDAQWTRKYLLPFFDFDHGATQACQAWDGFLAWGRLNPEVANDLEIGVRSILTNNDADLIRRRNRFIEYFTQLVAFYYEEPLEKWIPLFMNRASEEQRSQFARQVGHLLTNLESSEILDLWNRWLNQYWRNRLQGTPVPLRGDEIPAMLNWLPSLADVFPKAVSIAVQMPPTCAKQLRLSYDLKDHDVVSKHPQSVIRIIEYLLTTGSPNYILHGFKEIATRLKQLDLSTDLAHRLEVIQAQLG